MCLTFAYLGPLSFSVNHLISITLHDKIISKHKEYLFSQKDITQKNDLGNVSKKVKQKSFKSDY